MNLNKNLCDGAKLALLLNYSFYLSLSASLLLVKCQRLSQESILEKSLHKKYPLVQKVETIVKFKLTLAILKLYNFAVLGFNSSQRANEITM